MPATAKSSGAQVGVCLGAWHRGFDTVGAYPRDYAAADRDSVRLGGRLLRLLSGNFRAPLSRLGKSDRDCLFAALDRTALAAFAGFEGTPLFAVHGALHTFRRSLSIFCHFILLIKINPNVVQFSLYRRHLNLPSF